MSGRRGDCNIITESDHSQLLYKQLQTENDNLKQKIVELDTEYAKSKKELATLKIN